MEVFGERWAAAIMRELLFGPMRFSELRDALPDLSAKVLTERLVSLAQFEVIERQEDATASRHARGYVLTSRGHDAAQPLLSLERWGMAAERPARLPLSPTAFLFGMKATIDVMAARAFGTASIGFLIGGNSFAAELRDGELTLRRGLPNDVMAVFEAPDARALQRMMREAKQTSALPRSGPVTLTGQKLLALRFAALFDV